MNYKDEALHWVRNHGQSNTDYLSALHAIEFMIDDALTISESIEDVELCFISLTCALNILFE